MNSDLKRDNQNNKNDYNGIVRTSMIVVRKVKLFKERLTSFKN